MSGKTLHYKQHLDLKIGQYYQVHEHEEPSKNKVPRSKGAICLGPSGNEQGGFRFMSLKSAKNITRRSLGTNPMPVTIISCANNLA